MLPERTSVYVTFQLRLTVFCLQPKLLLHVVAGCNTYLTEGRFTWRHNSALKFLAEMLQTIQNAKLYFDLPGYLSPCIVTGNSLSPYILLSTAGNILLIIELNVGFETNLNNNAYRNGLKYRPLYLILPLIIRK